MSAETLRRAAALMRERAESASGSPWQHVAIEDEDGAADSYVISLTGFTSIGEDVGEAMAVGDAEHIASWHPAVALAVAGLLEFAAPFGNQPQPYSPTVEHAMTIARAYLGESS